MRITRSLARQGAFGGVVVCGLLTLAFAAHATTTSPDSQKYYEAAQREIAKGDPNAAIVELKNAVRADPSNGDARYQLGLLYFSNGSSPAALAELEALNKQGYDPQKVLPLLAQSYLALGRFKDVLSGVSPGATQGGGDP